MVLMRWCLVRWDGQHCRHLLHICTWGFGLGPGLGPGSGFGLGSGHRKPSHSATSTMAAAQVQQLVSKHSHIICLVPFWLQLCSLVERLFWCGTVPPSEKAVSCRLFPRFIKHWPRCYHNHGCVPDGVPRVYMTGTSRVG